MSTPAPDARSGKPPIILRPEFIDHELRNLSPRAVTVLLAILSHIDNERRAYPGLVRIGELAGSGWRSAKRAVKELEAAGLITCEHRTGMSTQYVVSERVTARGCTADAPPDGTPANSDRGEVETPAISDTPPLPNLTGVPLPNLRTRTKNQLTKNQRTKNSSSPKLRFTDQDKATAAWMFDLIQQMNPENKVPNLNAWANDIRLIRERDGRTDEQIRTLFSWANADNFWKTNILSPVKLRAKWDQLTIKMRNSNGNGKPSSADPGKRHPEDANRGPGVL